MALAMFSRVRHGHIALQQATALVEGCAGSRKAAHTGEIVESTDNMRRGGRHYYHAVCKHRADRRTDPEDIIAIDVALRRNDRDWFETLPDKINRHIVKSSITGIFSATSSTRTISWKGRKSDRA